jgi:hypothetical protein
MVLVSTLFNRKTNIGKTFVEETDPKTWFKGEMLGHQKLLSTEIEAFNTHNLIVAKKYKEVRPDDEIIQEEQETKRV